MVGDDACLRKTQVVLDSQVDNVAAPEGDSPEGDSPEGGSLEGGSLEGRSCFLPARETGHDRGLAEEASLRGSGDAEEAWDVRVVKGKGERDG